MVSSSFTGQPFLYPSSPDSTLATIVPLLNGPYPQG